MISRGTGISDAKYQAISDAFTDYVDDRRLDHSRW